VVVAVRAADAAHRKACRFDYPQGLFASSILVVGRKRFYLF
jgi:hypothetical protein